MYVHLSQVLDSNVQVDKLLAKPYYKGLYKKMLELGAEASRNTYQGMTISELPIVFREGNGMLYHIPENKL